MQNGKNSHWKTKNADQERNERICRLPGSWEAPKKPIGRNVQI